MEAALDAIFTHLGLEPAIDRVTHRDCLWLLQKHAPPAPDVAKLEAEVAELKAAMGESMLSSIPRNKALEAENARLRQALQRVDGIDTGAEWHHIVAELKRAIPTVEQALAASPAPSAWREMERDKVRLDWLEKQAKASSTGISFDWCRYAEEGYVVEHGFRFMRRHFLGERKQNIRAAIDAVMPALPEPPAREEASRGSR